MKLSHRDIAVSRRLADHVAKRLQRQVWGMALVSAGLAFYVADLLRPSDAQTLMSGLQLLGLTFVAAGSGIIIVGRRHLPMTLIRALVEDRLAWSQDDGVTVLSRYDQPITRQERATAQRRLGTAATEDEIRQAVREARWAEVQRYRPDLSREAWEGRRSTAPSATKEGNDAH